MQITQDAYDVLDAVMKIDASETMLDAIAAIAQERAENMRLKREGEWLKGRINQEEKRISNA